MGERIREQWPKKERILDEGEKEDRKRMRNGEREEGQIEYRARNREDRGRGWKTAAQPQVEERLERQEAESREARKVRGKILETPENETIERQEMLKRREVKD